ncbi:nitroreductase family protein [Niallia nealsonii]|uniref:Nitroreductase family protein n=1 Tax=Niallia nealsonii TaxID=115979 RepID=A0A2N0Z7E1_9BACI|nr:nitroreductase family protein [Niallia nealsonii]PKG25404.1 nitroreductase family protein [Niallia nealsonii]
MTTTITSTDFFQVLKERRAVKVYDESYKLTKAEIEELLTLAGRAPSAWNLQQWNFVVFHGEEAQQRLLPIAFNQAQIAQSSAVIAILGDLEANKNAEQIFAEDIEKGRLTEEIGEIIKGQINGAYENPDYPRDAANSNASLAAMQLMIAAKGAGLDTCAIGGFNRAAFVKEFQISERYLPIMLITIGKAAAPGRETDRLPLDQVTTWI